MIITNKVKLDLQKPGTTPTVNAVQNDCYSRNLEIALFADHRPFAFPGNGTVVIRYKKSDGKGGEYDTLPDGTTAWWAERNILTVALAPQVLTTPGSVLLSVTLIVNEAQLSVFPIRLAVEPIAAGKLAESENYFYITGLLPAPVDGKVGQFLQISAVNDKGRITALEAVDSILPQKGVDYWTDADKESIVQDVLSALGTPVFGTVDEQNNIILSGVLADGTYTLKYEDVEGNLTEIGTIEVGGITDDSGPIAIEWAIGVKLDKNTGAEGSGGNYSASQSIPYDTNYTYTITTTDNTSFQATICWYDINGGYLGNNGAIAGGSAKETETAVLVPLNDAASFRIRGYTSTANTIVVPTILNTVSMEKELIQ